MEVFLAQIKPAEGVVRRWADSRFFTCTDHLEDGPLIRGAGQAANHHSFRATLVGQIGELPLSPAVQRAQRIPVALQDRGIADGDCRVNLEPLSSSRRNQSSSEMFILGAGKSNAPMTSRK